jgi:2'-5' RNA ligase
MTSLAEGARPWRCFWAVPLPDDLRASLARFVASLRSQPRVDAEWRFTEAEAWHVTLAFLGGIEPASVEPMVGRVRAVVEGHAPFEVMAGGIGGVPSGRLRRVRWVGVRDDDGRLAALARDLRSAVGLELDQPFRPHVTLARTRDRSGSSVPRSTAPAPADTIPVSEAVLFRSHLGRGPARYANVARITLRALATSGAAR